MENMYPRKKKTNVFLGRVWSEEYWPRAVHKFPLRRQQYTYRPNKLQPKQHLVFTISYIYDTENESQTIFLSAACNELSHKFTYSTKIYKRNIKKNEQTIHFYRFFF